jgi:hypothetical protein
VGVGCVGLSRGRGRSDSITLLPFLLRYWFPLFSFLWCWFCSALSFLIFSFSVDGFLLFVLHDTFSFLSTTQQPWVMNTTNDTSTTQKTTPHLPSGASFHDKPHSRPPSTNNSHDTFFFLLSILISFFRLLLLQLSSNMLGFSSFFFCFVLFLPLFRSGFTFLAFFSFTCSGWIARVSDRHGL